MLYIETSDHRLRRLDVLGGNLGGKGEALTWALANLQLSQFILGHPGIQSVAKDIQINSIQYEIAQGSGSYGTRYEMFHSPLRHLRGLHWFDKLLHPGQHSHFSYEQLAESAGSGRGLRGEFFQLVFHLHCPFLGMGNGSKK